MAEFEMMTIYLVFAFLSLLAATTVYWFGIEMHHYLRLVRLKNMVADSHGNQDGFLDANTEDSNLNSWEQRIQKMLRLAGLEMRSWQLYAITLLVSAVFSAGFVLFLQHWLGLLIGIIAGVGVVIMVLNGKKMGRKIEFNRSFSIAISVLVKMMRNGIGFEQALNKSVMTSNSVMFRTIFERFLHEKNRIGEIEAFENMNRHIDSKELRIFALAVKIGRESGGHFSATLEKVEETLRYRKKMQDKVSVVTREASIGSYLVASLNVLLYFMIDMNFNGKVNEYFLNSEWGRWQLFGIGLWMILGLAVNRQITRIEV